MQRKVKNTSKHHVNSFSIIVRHVIACMGTEEAFIFHRRSNMYILLIICMILNVFKIF